MFMVSRLVMVSLIYTYLQTHQVFFCFKYLLVLFLAASGLSCGTLIFVVVLGFLSSCGVWAPENVGSVVVAHMLSSCITQA